MADQVELAITGQVTASVLVNLRQGAPSVQAPVVRKIAAGATLTVQAIVVGDPVQGNAHWYEVGDSLYVWAGACGPLQQGGPAAAPPAQGPNRQTLLTQIPLVIDLSHGDSVVDFGAAKTAGVVGVIHKATTGATGHDDAYSRRRQMATDAGLLWGAYHWGTHAPVADQIANFRNWADPDENTLVALDYETTADDQMTLDDCRGFCQGIVDWLHRPCVIYSGNVLKSALGNTVDPFFKDYRLWLAQYGDNPTVQPSFSSYWLWQYTDGDEPQGPQKVPGIQGDAKGRTDCDYFNGSPGQLAQQWAI
jgi:GH25 family lysozyme M1 (1,4-beta-N-acetylmuramidase)